MKQSRFSLSRDFWLVFSLSPFPITSCNMVSVYLIQGVFSSSSFCWFIVISAAQGCLSKLYSVLYVQLCLMKSFRLWCLKLPPNCLIQFKIICQKFKIIFVTVWNRRLLIPTSELELCIGLGPSCIQHICQCHWKLFIWSGVFLY